MKNSAIIPCFDCNFEFSFCDGKKGEKIEKVRGRSGAILRFLLGH